ncbi:uncharacterized protein LOC131233797 [Magnolia sinica]|uniref:uncharacterized protein LOC131233797 n=1 Tax=Magnolia sinica TaxID=86752 RepID=UPI00265870E0|nr:uncharacterized protein LOC131233797 [Magnolia sinica]
MDFIKALAGRNDGFFLLTMGGPSFPNLSQSLSPIFHGAADSRFLLFRLFIHRRSTPPHRSMESTNFFKSCTPREVEDTSQSQPHIDIELENDINELRSSNVYTGDSGIDENASNLKIGKEFETEKDAYKFYNSYGWKVSFSVRIDTRTIDRKTRVVKMRKFVCSREDK